jgi:hypothetical protein
MNPVKEQIIEMMKECAKQGIKPTTLYVPLVIEAALNSLSIEDIGESLATMIFISGIRMVLTQNGNKLYGLDVKWHANEFKVE